MGILSIRLSVISSGTTQIYGKFDGEFDDQAWIIWEFQISHIPIRTHLMNNEPQQIVQTTSQSASYLTCFVPKPFPLLWPLDICFRVSNTWPPDMGVEVAKAGGRINTLIHVVATLW